MVSLRSVPKASRTLTANRSPSQPYCTTAFSSARMSTRSRTGTSANSGLPSLSTGAS